jgi:hypothetical protein
MIVQAIGVQVLLRDCLINSADAKVYAIALALIWLSDCVIVCEGCLVNRCLACLVANEGLRPDGIWWFGSDSEWHLSVLGSLDWMH